MNQSAAILVLAAVTISYAVGLATRPDESSPAMKPFVLIFRQRPTQLSEADLKRRADEVRIWAQEQNAQGRKLDPRALGPESYAIGPDGNEASTAPADAERLTAILFIEARDLEDAVGVARSHPALRFGVVRVDVRPWSARGLPVEVAR